MYTSNTNHLGPSSGPAAAYRAVLHTAEVVPRDGRTRWRAVQSLLEGHPVLGAHDVIQDRIYSGAEVIQTTAQRIQPLINVAKGGHLIHVQQPLSVKGRPADEKCYHDRTCGMKASVSFTEPSHCRFGDKRIG